MARYVLIESRDPYESKSFGTRCELAASLARDGNETTVMLVENGVFAARASGQVRVLERTTRAGVSVIADEFALRERGIAASDLAECVKAVRLEELIVQMGMGARALWS
jgi:sulfur relay (sulfurtransferase) complex TusBCD TusD component (DsrE family)